MTQTWQFFENCQFSYFYHNHKREISISMHLKLLKLSQFDFGQFWKYSGYILALPVCDLHIITITIENVNFLDFLGHCGWAILGSELLSRFKSSIVFLWTNYEISSYSFLGWLFPQTPCCPLTCVALYFDN